MIEVPEFLPVLSAGSHAHPKKGACLMEYVSMIAGEPFSDNPICTDPVVAGCAIRVNDEYREGEYEARSRDLTPYIPRLVNTRISLDTNSQEYADIRREQAERALGVYIRWEEGVASTSAELWRITQRALREEMDARYVKGMGTLTTWAQETYLHYEEGHYARAAASAERVLNTIAGGGLEGLEAVLGVLEEHLGTGDSAVDWQELRSQTGDYVVRSAT